MPDLATSFDQGGRDFAQALRAPDHPASWAWVDGIAKLRGFLSLPLLLFVFLVLVLPTA